MTPTIGAELNQLHGEVNDIYKYAFRTGRRADEKRLEILWRRIDVLEDERQAVRDSVVFV